ncbi:hypothetical protein PRIPAC_70399 [Pristionchus pacificus]|uniref:Uncharacterized protein n=1 Tax=Pristionchus pacificus TaxID=54126 RepID=A0A2A6CFU9_PRIPA|nr:hypothetical protein PRIPAC_70399 [Pristionchus pacificus]|eukprot:PDM76957.1 hypothetical protein PRIPAC_42352 [Pristionchus pacificus]
MNREADNVCSSCKNCGSAVIGQPMAFPSHIRPSLKPTASSTPSTLVFKSEQSQLRSKSSLQGLAKELLREDYLKIVVDKIDAANKSITLDFVQIERRNKKATLLRMVVQVFKQKTLVFVASKTMTDTLEVFISEAGTPTTTTHGVREQVALTIFFRTSVKLRWPIFGREDAHSQRNSSGREGPGHFGSRPFHRIGHTGRLGKPGHSTSFIDSEHAYEVILPLIRQLAKSPVDAHGEPASQEAQTNGGDSQREGTEGTTPREGRMLGKRKRKCFECGHADETTRTFPANSRTTLQKQWLDRLGLNGPETIKK